MGMTCEGENLGGTQMYIVRKESLPPFLESQNMDGMGGGEGSAGRQNEIFFRAIFSRRLERRDSVE